jgi:hypothetical protein
MGDLFTMSTHSDKVLYKGTSVLLNEIENKLKMNMVDKNWKILFHISKLLDNTESRYPLKIT